MHFLPGVKKVLPPNWIWCAQVIIKLLQKETVFQKMTYFSGDGTDGKLSKAEGGSDKANENQDENTGIGILEEMLDNLDQFVLEPSPQGCVVKCRITRDRKGMDRGKEQNFGGS